MGAHIPFAREELDAEGIALAVQDALSEVLGQPAAGSDLSRNELEHIETVTEPSLPAVRHFVSVLAGVALQWPFAARCYRTPDGKRAAILAVHRFGPPKEQSAELIVLSERFRWTRSTLRAALGWLAWDLDVLNVNIRIAAPDRRTQNLARRAGFRFVGHGTLDDGRACSSWSINLLDAYAGGAGAIPRICGGRGAL